MDRVGVLELQDPWKVLSDILASAEGRDSGGKGQPWAGSGELGAENHVQPPGLRDHGMFAACRSRESA